MKIENNMNFNVDNNKPNSVSTNTQITAKKVNEETSAIPAVPVATIQNTFGSEMNTEKINDIKSKIANGTFQVNADAIAEKILNDKDNLKFLMG